MGYTQGGDVCKLWTSYSTFKIDLPVKWVCAYFKNFHEPWMGNGDDPGNYKPACPSSVVGKLLENTPRDRIYSHLEELRMVSMALIISGRVLWP